MAQPSFRHAWKSGSPPPGFEFHRRSITKIDPLTASAHVLQDMLTAGEVKSADLAEHYISRIEQYNGYLNAVFQYAPGVMQRAKDMDEKRSQGTVLGPLHGIPILLKDNMCTTPDLGMHTTGGAVALIGAECSSNAEVVQKLLDAGAVILGKTTLSELNFNRDSHLPCSWSAVAGMGQSPYVKGGVDPNDNAGGHSNPGGSSSGSAIAVAAGLAPIAVGSDTDASLTAPGVRAALYTLRPTLNLVPVRGVLPMAHSFDTAGPMAKNPRDLANLLDVLVDPSTTKVPSGGYVSVLDQSWTGIRIGALDPEIWQYPDWLCKPEEAATQQIIRDTRNAYARVRSLADSFHENVELLEATEFMLNGDHSIYTIVADDFEEDMNGFLSELTKKKFDDLRGMVKWNAENVEEALTKEYPGQDKLTGALETNLSVDARNETVSHYKRIGASFDEILKKYDINIIIAPGDCFFCQYGPANGYPVAALPLTTLDFNGRPIGIQAIAAAHQEPLLLKFMSAWEATFPRPVPHGYGDVSPNDHSL
ncbi:amidase signature enzyme [Pseudovirgaria hyperparasitica]|uniref:Amidase signature enzyme n=1 Tax=Pseudovirgaria hyperparasitica TaxID=470096 RepID=A0A6A6WB75_9PEZI|nr:amidase signature enzyme [Pseudovirgaria hyperparasitica]KAF2759933.1 amidase signature enzyme [Pseudovirgaria hyperparasitica]